METKQKKKIVKKSEPSMYASGYVSGQRKLASCILDMEFKNISDYEWLLSHLKEVSEGREVISNSVIGFEKNTIS